MKSRHLFGKLLMAGLLAAGLASCGEDDPSRVTGVELSAKTMTLEKEDTCELTATITPDTALNTLVTYTSTNEEILSVSTKNAVECHTPVTITALKDGTASIVVTTNDGKKTDKCDFTITTSEYSITSDVEVKSSYIAYKNNKKEGLSDAEQFVIPNLEYNVGCNNPINLMPYYEVWSEAAEDFVDNLKWKYPHEIKVEIKGLDGTYNTADASYYDVVSDRTCDIKFNTNAVGKVFKVSITPGNLSNEYKALHPNSKTAVYEDLKVIDGYNIYTADELSLIDTREEADNPWYAFKEAKGISNTLHPTTLILHNNLEVKTSNMPADYFWSGLEGNFSKYNGTLKDWAEVYRHTTGDNLNVYGNYFRIDFSQLPVVEYKDGAAISDSFVSHALLIGIDNGSASFNNLNLLGNASKSKQKDDGSQDTSGRGGFIFCKGRMLADAVTANNNLFRSWFITYMGEDSTNDVGYVNFVLNSCKGRDNYNSFLYNWGGKMTCNNCSFKSCGGPIVISDHIDVQNNDYGEVDGSVVKGIPASTTFIDCELINYVAGTEAWFVQFGAVALVSTIKSMSDLYLSKGAAYLVAENPTAKGTYIPCAFTQATSTATGGAVPYITPNFFNFIAFNKSGSNEGMTNLPVHGEVNIINTGKKTNQKFCYSRPNMYSSSEIQTLITLAIKYGLYTAENADVFETLESLIDNADVNTATDKAVCSAIRQLNANGAPVFQCGSNFATILDQANPSLIDVKTIASTPQPSAADFASYVSPVDKTSVLRQESTALYYNGMMMVFGLTGFNL